jgi:hypothetical protein
MDGVAAEVAQEVIVFFQDNNLDPGTGQQEGVNQTGGTASGDTYLGLKNARHALTLLTRSGLTGTLASAADSAM